MNNKKAFFCAGLFLLLGINISAQKYKDGRGVPAYPFPVSFEADGDVELMLSKKGNRIINWYETKDGYTLIKNDHGGLVYAQKDIDGDLVPSEYNLNSNVEILPMETGLSYSDKQIASRNKIYSTYKQIKANPTPFPHSGENNVLVILAEFSDQSSRISVAGIDSMMNFPGYNGIGSFRDYYLDVSYNQLILNTTVVPWVEVSNTMRYYGENIDEVTDARPEELVREALDLVELRGFDFSQFDNDLDGYVDEIIVLHAGYGEQYPGAGDTCIWSHAYSLGDLSVEYDGVILDNYVIASELYGNSGDQINSIGTVVHEFAHSLAVPDLYDIDYEGSGGQSFDLNFWDLMAVGSWNNNGNTPAGINAWAKSYMGWMEIPMISDPGTYSLNNAFQNQEAYRLNTPVYNEYFIVENRQRIGFDAFMPGEGMLIYHVDQNYAGWHEGYINVDPNHQGFDLEEADDIRDSTSLAGDAFPGTAGITSFTGSTSPGSRTWNGAESSVELENITESLGVVSFEILSTTTDTLPVGWEVDLFSYTQQAQISLGVLLGVDTINHGHVGAFVGETCRGIAPVTYHPDSAVYAFNMLVFSNASIGEDLSFKYYDDVNDTIYDLYEEIEFVADSETGASWDPVYLHMPSVFTKAISQGWNWFSMNVEMNDMSPDAVFTSCNAAGDYVKNQTLSSTYYSGWGWFGTMNELNVNSLYLINASEACEIDVIGVPVDPDAVNIDLAAGWNWMPYIPQEALAPNDALAGFSASAFDYIKNQTYSATYYDGYGWFGTLQVMNPGEGFMMRVAEGGSFQYPSGGQEVKKGKIGQVNGFEQLNPYAFEFNGSLTARISSSDYLVSEDDVLYAYYGDTCCGEVHGLYFEPGDEVLFSLMVYGNQESGQEMTFKYYNAAIDSVLDINETIAFEKDMVLGSAYEAVKMTIVSGVFVDKGNVESLNCNAYPNPVTDLLTIDFVLESNSMVNIEIFDIYGKFVDRVQSGYFEVGSHTLAWDVLGLSSVYILKIDTGESQRYFRILAVH